MNLMLLGFFFLQRFYHAIEQLIKSENEYRLLKIYNI